MQKEKFQTPKGTWNFPYCEFDFIRRLLWLRHHHLQQVHLRHLRLQLLLHLLPLPHHPPHLLLKIVFSLLIYFL